MSGDNLGAPIARPPDHWSPAKLTAAQREQIYERYQAGESAARLAQEFGVTASTIRASFGPRR